MNSPKNEVKSYPNIVKTGGTWLVSENNRRGSSTRVRALGYSTSFPHHRVGRGGEQRSSGRWDCLVNNKQVFCSGLGAADSRKGCTVCQLAKRARGPPGHYSTWTRLLFFIYLLDLQPHPLLMIVAGGLRSGKGNDFRKQLCIIFNINAHFINR